MYFSQGSEPNGSEPCLKQLLAIASRPPGTAGTLEFNPEPVEVPLDAEARKKARKEALKRMQQKIFQEELKQFEADGKKKCGRVFF